MSKNDKMRNTKNHLVERQRERLFGFSSYDINLLVAFDLLDEFKSVIDGFTNQQIQEANRAKQKSEGVSVLSDNWKPLWCK